MKLERWRSVDGLPDYYRVSDKGRVLSLSYVDARGWRRKKKLLSYKDAQITLRRKWYSVGALVLRAFVGPPPKGCRLARHLNDDRTNNCLENLAWGTDQDNINDALRNGTTFVTYGHLGKKHSAETKYKLSVQRKGIPTGRVISAKHRAALIAGYKKYQENRHA